jgi:4-amino-4-deoxy-L-arabinose transferase-like glycosyltransferase
LPRGSARRLGGRLAALFCATLPMGILQSTSTQNDFVVAYWLACLVALVTDATTRGWR